MRKSFRSTCAAMYATRRLSGLKVGGPIPRVAESRRISHSREPREHSTFSWLLEPMLEHAGFTIDAVTHSESQIYAAYVCRRL